MTPEERFWKNVDIRGPDECWPWKLSCDKDGYGQAWFEGKIQRAHRVAFKISHPEEGVDGLEIHHIDCETKACCNPAHLESHHWVTHREVHLKTHCKRGHEYTHENTGFQASGAKYCRECKAQRNQKEKVR